MTMTMTTGKLWLSLTALQWLITCPKKIPQAHEGVFVSGNDTLVFNGDGKSLSWHFEQADSLIGNNGQGQYVFLLGHMMYRYDVAETFRDIATENQNASHSFMIYKRPVTETEIVILRDDLPGHVVEQFKKIAE